jgi:hypothetical protein
MLAAAGYTGMEAAGCCNQWGRRLAGQKIHVREAVGEETEEMLPRQCPRMISSMAECGVWHRDRISCRLDKEAVPEGIAAAPLSGRNEL